MMTRVPDARGPLGQKTIRPSKAYGKAYMAAVATIQCVICGAWPVSVHHAICGRYSGRKAADTDTMPLCYNHHQGADGIHTNQTAWVAKYGADTDYIPSIRGMVEKLLDAQQRGVVV